MKVNTHEIPLNARMTVIFYTHNNREVVVPIGVTSIRRGKKFALLKNFD